MTAIQEIRDKNQIERHDIDNLSSIVFDSILLKGSSKSTSQLKKKEKLIDVFSNFIEQLIELRLISSKGNNLELINFIDKLNMQRELLELEKGETTISDTQTAAGHLGKKAQSAFEGQWVDQADLPDFDKIAGLTVLNQYDLWRPIIPTSPDGAF